eukprot:scaffold9388_cov148-Skeletonema_marinoi.AAC.27
MTHIHLEYSICFNMNMYPPAIQSSLITTTYLQHCSSDTLFKGDEGVDLRLLACSRVEGSHWKCEVCVSII